jgi:hypothetical protein
MAIERVKPIPRDTAHLNVSKMITDAKARNTTEAVDYLVHRFMRVPPDASVNRKLVAFLDKELGTSEIETARTYMEQPLRLVLHLIMSQPEYQLS